MTMTDAIYYMALAAVALLKITTLILVMFVLVAIILSPLLLPFLFRKPLASAIRRLFAALLVVVVVLTAGAVHAQIPVTDVLAQVEHITNVVLQETIKAIRHSQAERVYKMSLRLSQWVSLTGYNLHRDLMPEWRIHCWFAECGGLFANDYLHALTYGDWTGAGYDTVTVPRRDPAPAFSAGFTTESQAIIRSNLATLDLVDSALVRGTHTAGQYRFGGRAEAEAIINFQAMVTDEDLEQSLAAKLDHVAAAKLVTVQNKQARAAMDVALLEQLAVEGVLERETDAAVNNMRLTRMFAEDGEGGPPSITAGATSALQGWHLR